MRTGAEGIPDSDPPDAAVTMVHTRIINDWLNTHYTLEEVAEMDWLTFEILAALRKGLAPPDTTEKVT